MRFCSPPATVQQYIARYLELTLRLTLRRVADLPHPINFKLHDAFMPADQLQPDKHLDVRPCAPPCNAIIVNNVIIIRALCITL